LRGNRKRVERLAVCYNNQHGKREKEEGLFHNLVTMVS
jgi:hypothetical protein